MSGRLVGGSYTPRPLSTPILLIITNGETKRLVSLRYVKPDKLQLSTNKIKAQIVEKSKLRSSREVDVEASTARSDEEQIEDALADREEDQ
ncbi:hypothetical protein Pmar_PMAR007375 [Perkinsus marinus ATCC 50983]|uniref:Uncharacterized protein n=1 Tax=Perkinsus marinus (strain ATCC 50983 / TXsc) TaxID=423536 RepID=C5K660_PERM5|nr:hypothetical protein Pmar_PMAR007375 [Perkinsus marinus ATCC 50983]EER20090.1 hypothetical protein Pmar_PMAR007375 [Perkinsus marinus ATCC 50983]|eukprot:XP_002788294.1 hypothetical protein Pmar_PMAR007375 [Perkinsus marinus ATCC 50983]